MQQTLAYCLLWIDNLYEVVNIKLSRTYGLPPRSSWSSGRTERWEDKEFIRGCEIGKRSGDRSTWKGHFLLTEIRKGFLEDLTPELNLEGLGVNQEGWFRKQQEHTICKGTKACKFAAGVQCNRKGCCKWAAQPCMLWGRSEQKGMKSAWRTLRKWRHLMCLLERKITSQRMAGKGEPMWGNLFGNEIV